MLIDNALSKAILSKNSTMTFKLSNYSQKGIYALKTKKVSRLIACCYERLIRKLGISVNLNDKSPNKSFSVAILANFYRWLEYFRHRYEEVFKSVDWIGTLQHQSNAQKQKEIERLEHLLIEEGKTRDEAHAIVVEELARIKEYFVITVEKMSKDNPKLPQEEVIDLAIRYMDYIGENPYEVSPLVFGKFYIDDKRGIGINRLYFEDYKGLMSYLKKEIDEKNHPQGTLNSAYILVHEFGHAFYKYLDENSLLHIVFDKQMLQEIDKDEEYIKEQLSEYSNKGIRGDREEFFAEAFAEYILNPNPRPLSAMFGYKLEAAYWESVRLKEMPVVAAD